MHGLGARETTPWLRIALIWLVLAVLIAAVNARSLIEWRFPDPDDALRLVQVRDLIAGQPWFDLHQYRIDPGNSPVMHWSRIVDAPIALVILLLRPLIGQPAAEQIALIVIPLLTLGVILVLVGRLAARLFDREIAGLACLACGLSPLLVWQVQPLRIDHHAWQIAAVMLAVSAVLGQRARRGGAVAGFAVAVGLSISLEVLPHAAAIGAVLLLRWLRDPAQRWWLASYLNSLAAWLVVLFLATHGISNLDQYCDAISPAHIGLFAIVALGCSGMAARPNLAPAGIVLLLGAVGLLGVGFFLISAPQCAGGPFGSLDPLVREYWYVNVWEGLPAWQQFPERALPIVLQALAALGAAAVLWMRSRSDARALWFDYLLLLAAAVLAGLLVWRSMAFVGALGAVPLGWLAARLLEKLRRAAGSLQKLGIAVMLVLTLEPQVMVAAAKPFIKHRSPETPVNTVSKLDESTCRLAANVPQLRRLPPSTIFAPLDIGPDILDGTRHSVVATGHHRAQAAMRDVILAFTSPERKAHEIVARHRAEYLVVCTDLAEPYNYVAAARNGLMAQLLEGDAPNWLQPVQLNTPPALKVWKVVE